MLTRILISFIPITIISLFVIIVERKNLKNIKFNTILTVIICGLVSTIFKDIPRMILKFPMGLLYVFIDNLVPNMLSMTFLLAFIDNLFVAAIPEEVSKWTCLKISKPKSPYKILLHSIFIALIFMTHENYTYMYDLSSNFLGLYRVFIPIHIVCQLIMALLIIKSNEKKNEGKKKYSIFLQILSVLIPILLHTMYNTYTNLTTWKLPINEVNVLPMVIILGICTYIATFIAIINVRRKYTNDETNDNKEKTKLSIKKLILVIIMFVLLFVMEQESNISKINETLTIERQNIDITVNSIEEVKITDTYFNNGTYVKVHLDIKNNGSETIEISSLFSFNLLKDDEIIDVSSYTADDIINLDIPSGETSSGYLYFETELIDGLQLEYIDENLDVENLEGGFEHYYIELN